MVKISSPTFPGTIGSKSTLDVPSIVTKSPLLSKDQCRTASGPVHPAAKVLVLATVAKSVVKHYLNIFQFILLL